MTILRRIKSETRIEQLNRWRLLCHLMSALWLANILGFIVTTSQGGNALEGKIEHGRYYLHGTVKAADAALSRFTEVRPFIFYLNLGFLLFNFIVGPASVMAFLVRRRIEERLKELRAG